MRLNLNKWLNVVCDANLLPRPVPECVRQGRPLPPLHGTAGPAPPQVDHLQVREEEEGMEKHKE